MIISLIATTDDGECIQTSLLVDEPMLFESWHPDAIIDVELDNPVRDFRVALARWARAKKLQALKSEVRP